MDRSIFLSLFTCKCCVLLCSSDDNRRGTLLAAGVCMRVPFSRVTIKEPAKSLEETEEVDIAGV